METRNSALICNGTKIKAQRTQLGMTQEKLAGMSDVDVRTIQRAEKSGSMQLETVASIAAAISLTVTEITLSMPMYARGDTDEPFNAVVLRPTKSGKALLDIICGSFSGRLICDAEPTIDNVDLLASIVERIEELMPDPWRTPMEDIKLSLAARLRLAVEISSQLLTLNAAGITVYAGAYTASAQIPYFDIDEGSMCVTNRTPFRPVTACRVVIDHTGRDSIVQEVTDKWEPPPDEIPF